MLIVSFEGLNLFFMYIFPVLQDTGNWFIHASYLTELFGNHFIKQ